jgi:hypothetical protein
MFCPKCGQSNVNGAKFCVGCGAGLPQGMAQPQPAGPSYQQPQYGPQMPPAPAIKKKKVPLFVKILMGVFIFIILVVFLAMSMTAGLVRAVEDHLSLLKKGDLQGAYMLTSKEFRNTLSLEQYRAFVSQYPFLMRNKSHSFNEREFKDNVGKVRGKLISEDGAVVPVVFNLVKEGGQWRIIGIGINPRD